MIITEYWRRRLRLLLLLLLLLLRGVWKVVQDRVLTKARRPRATRARAPVLFSVGRMVGRAYLLPVVVSGVCTGNNCRRPETASRMEGDEFEYPRYIVSRLWAYRTGRTGFQVRAITVIRDTFSFCVSGEGLYSTPENCCWIVKRYYWCRSCINKYSVGLQWSHRTRDNDLISYILFTPPSHRSPEKKHSGHATAFAYSSSGKRFPSGDSSCLVKM